MADDTPGEGVRHHRQTCPFCGLTPPEWMSWKAHVDNCRRRRDEESFTEKALSRLLDAYTLLWVAAVVLFVGGDTLTSAAGVHVGMHESTPAVRWMLAQWGWLGLVAVKVGVCWLLWAFSRLLPRPYVYHAPALCLVLTGGYATLWNSWLIVHLTA